MKDDLSIWISAHTLFVVHEQSHNHVKESQSDLVNGLVGEREGALIGLYPLVKQTFEPVAI